MMWQKIKMKKTTCVKMFINCSSETDCSGISYLQVVTQLFVISPETSDPYLLWPPSVLGVWHYQKNMNCCYPQVQRRKTAHLAIILFPQTNSPREDFGFQEKEDPTFSV